MKASVRAFAPLVLPRPSRVRRFGTCQRRLLPGVACWCRRDRPRLRVSPRPPPRSRTPTCPGRVSPWTPWRLRPGPPRSFPVPDLRPELRSCPERASRARARPRARSRHLKRECRQTPAKPQLRPRIGLHWLRGPEAQRAPANPRLGLYVRWQPSGLLCLGTRTCSAEFCVPSHVGVEARPVDPDRPTHPPYTDLALTHQLPQGGPRQARNLFCLPVGHPLSGYLCLHLHSFLARRRPCLRSLWPGFKLSQQINDK